MRSIRLIWIGKSQEPFVQDGIKVYLKKLSHYIKVDFEEIKPVKYNSGTTDQWRRQETEKLLKRLDSTELNIFLDESGKSETSKSLARWFEKQIPLGWRRANFFISKNLDAGRMIDCIEFDQVKIGSFAQFLCQLNAILSIDRLHEIAWDFQILPFAAGYEFSRG